MKEIFHANQFLPTPFETSAHKTKFANQFVRFVESDFKRSKFPRWFYLRLSVIFGHIAHYHQAGFYETFFTTPKGKVDFIAACLNGGGYGDPAHTYSDVEQELKKWLRKNAVWENLQEKFELAADDIEMAWVAAAKFRNQRDR